MRIPYCKGESFSVNNDGKAIAMYLAEKWMSEGKRVETRQSEKYITVSYTESGCLSYDQEGEE